MALINKKLIHVDAKTKLTESNSPYMFATSANNSYYLRLSNYKDQLTTGGFSGTTVTNSSSYKGIKYQSIVFIKDTLEIWTHGLLYSTNSSEYKELLSKVQTLENNHPFTQWNIQIVDGLTNCTYKDWNIQEGKEIAVTVTKVIKGVSDSSTTSSLDELFNSYMSGDSVVIRMNDSNLLNSINVTSYLIHGKQGNTSISGSTILSNGTLYTVLFTCNNNSGKVSNVVINCSRYSGYLTDIASGKKLIDSSDISTLKSNVSTLQNLLKHYVRWNLSKSTAPIALESTLLGYASHTGENFNYISNATKIIGSFPSPTGNIGETSANDGMPYTDGIANGRYFLQMCRAGDEIRFDGYSYVCTTLYIMKSVVYALYATSTLLHVLAFTVIDGNIDSSKAIVKVVKTTHELSKLNKIDSIETSLSNANTKLNTLSTNLNTLNAVDLLKYENGKVNIQKSSTSYILDANLLTNSEYNALKNAETQLKGLHSDCTIVEYNPTSKSFTGTNNTTSLNLTPDIFAGGANRLRDVWTCGTAPTKNGNEIDSDDWKPLPGDIIMVSNHPYYVFHKNNPEGTIVTTFEGWGNNASTASFQLELKRFTYNGWTESPNVYNLVSQDELKNIIKLPGIISDIELLKNSVRKNWRIESTTSIKQGYTSQGSSEMEASTVNDFFNKSKNGDTVWSNIFKNSDGIMVANFIIINCPDNLKRYLMISTGSKIYVVLVSRSSASSTSIITPSASHCSEYIKS